MSKMVVFIILLFFAVLVAVVCRRCVSSLFYQEVNFQGRCTCFVLKLLISSLQGKVYVIVQIFIEEQLNYMKSYNRNNRTQQIDCDVITLEKRKVIILDFYCSRAPNDQNVSKYVRIVSNRFLYALEAFMVNLGLPYLFGNLGEIWSS